MSKYKNHFIIHHSMGILNLKSAFPNVAWGELNNGFEKPLRIQWIIRTGHLKMDLVRFVLCTLVSRDCVPFCKYIKHHVYPRIQDIYDKFSSCLRMSWTIVSKKWISALDLSLYMNFLGERLCLFWGVFRRI